MTFLAQPRQFTVASFTSYIAGLKWDKGWRPSFITGHNTASPRLSQYLAYTPDVRRRWPSNLNAYYKRLGWHSGPHIVICPDVDGGGIWLLCDLEQDGVSVSCWNRATIGIENVGDYETEDPTTGHGAEVRDQFVGVAAALCGRFGWTPRPQVIGKAGLHWHHQCSRDNHPCPGKNWNGNDVIARIEAAMGVQAPIAQAPAVHGPAWLQASLNKLGADPKLVVDGDIGPRTRAALMPWQFKMNLAPTGQPDSATMAAIEKALAALPA